MSEGRVPVPEARAAVERVLQSPEFASATRLSSFLGHVVREALAGRGPALKGYAIAVDVFGRPADFDQSTDPIVRVEASRLRRALAQYYQGSGAADPVIIGLPRGGYVPVFQWREGTEFARRGPADEEAAPPEETAAPPEEGDGLAETALPYVWLFRGLVLAGIAATLGLLGFLVWDAIERQSVTAETSAMQPVTQPSSGPPSVAVEPLTADGEADLVFARGLTTEIVAELARFREIAVFELEVAGPTPPSGYVLSGSVRRAEKDIRVTVQLLDAASRQIVWSESYVRDFTLENMLAIQDEVARSVAVAVAQPYGAVYEREQVNAATRPGSLDGYTCVLSAYEYWRSLERSEHRRVRDCLERTIAMEPGYADAWQALTYAYLDEYRYGYNARPPEIYRPLDKALETAQRAVALSPTDARSFQALYSAYFYRGDDGGFRRAGAEALVRNPNNPDIMADYGGKLAFGGRWEEGLPLVRRAMTLNPAHPGWYYVALVLDAYRRGQYAEAIALAQRMNMTNHSRTQVFLAMSYGELGDREHADEALGRLARLDPGFGVDARGEMTKWGIEPSLIEHCLEGLSKAGLALNGN